LKMTNGLFGGCFGHFNMYHHLNIIVNGLKNVKTWSIKGAFILEHIETD